MFENTTDIKSDVCQYLHDKGANFVNFDVLYWWKDHKQHYLMMAHVVRDLFFIPASMISIELLFSIRRDQLGIRCHNMSAEMLLQLIVIQYTEHEKRRNEAKKLNTSLQVSCWVLSFVFFCCWNICFVCFNFKPQFLLLLYLSISNPALITHLNKWVLWWHVTKILLLRF